MDRKSTIPDCHECPDLFELPVDGDKTKTKWVIVRGNGRYTIGSFDGVKFTGETPQPPSDAGPNYYATQTWENMQTGDGRRIHIAWMVNYACGYPNMPFNQQLSFPRELTLRSTPQGPRLFREPIKEIALLHGVETDFPSQDLTDNSRNVIRSTGEQFHILADVRACFQNSLWCSRQFNSCRHADLDRRQSTGFRCIDPCRNSCRSHVH